MTWWTALKIALREPAMINRGRHLFLLALLLASLIALWVAH